MVVQKCVPLVFHVCSSLIDLVTEGVFFGSHCPQHPQPSVKISSKAVSLWFAAWKNDETSKKNKKKKADDDAANCCSLGCVKQHGFFKLVCTMNESLLHMMPLGAASAALRRSSKAPGRGKMRKTPIRTATR